MSSDDASDLFEIKLSEEGTRYIRKLLPLAKSILILGILISAVSIANGIYFMMNNKLDFSGLSYWQNLYFKIFPFYQCLHSVLFLMQIYFYWKVRQYLMAGIKYKNEISFNRSFFFFYKNAVWTIITFVTAFIFSVLDFVYVLSLRY